MNIHTCICIILGSKLAPKDLSIGTIGPNSLYCGKWGKLLNAYSDLDLDPTKLNIKLVRAVFQFRVPRSISF